MIAQLRPKRLLAGCPRAQELALVCGERLLQLQLDSGGWPVGALSSQRKPSLTGFSHGAAGMAAALARLAQTSGQERFAEGARRAVAYERSVFDGKQGNWPDFRNSTEPDEFMLSWCHGAPGILLSRHVLQAADLADQQTAVELQAARSSTLKALAMVAGRSTGGAAHLCCGVLGLSSLLRVDASVAALELSAGLMEAESAVVREAQASGGYTFFSVDTGSLNLPGLFTGKAGVALALLEAADGLQVLPAVLSAGLLDPPHQVS